MDPAKALEELSSGDALRVMALIIVVQAVVLVVFWRKINIIQDCRLTEAIKAKDEVTELVVSSNRIMDSVNATLQQAIRTMEARK